MTKRFTLANPKNAFQEMKCGINDWNKTLTFNEVVDLLNDLHEERNYFERKKCRYWNKFNLAYLDIINLQKENEQLKNENAKMKKELSLLAEFNQKAIL